MKRRNWTRDELILALNLYLKLPFGKLHSNTPDIIHLAKIIDRTPSSVAMRLNNFASVDPYHQKRGIVGLQGGLRQVEPIWNEFKDNQEELLFESERILAEKEQMNVESKYEDVLLGIENLEGEEKIREVKTRVNQAVFRQIVLSNYAGRCAITGIDVQELLIASHIVPWAMNARERLNPENGLCLSGLYDSAYDKGLIGISTDYKIVISKTLKAKKEEKYYNVFFKQFEGAKISLPAKYYPNKKFVQFHLDTIFRG